MWAYPAIFFESPYARRVAASLGVFALILVIGAIGYLVIAPADTTVVDAVYMTFITISTIGFAEVIDLQGHPAGRVFTMLIALLGIANMTYLFSTVTAFFLETDLNRNYRRRRMQTSIDRLAGHYIVCGAGRIGGYVMRELREQGHRFVLIDVDPQAVARCQETEPELVCLEGDASDDDMLMRAGIARAAGVFAVTGDDAKNLVVSLSSKQLNPAARVVARIHDPRNTAKTLRAGADEIVSPDFTGAHRIASLMTRPQMVSLIDELVRSGGRLDVEELVLPEAAPITTVASLGRSDDWLLVAVRRGEAWQFNPPPEAPLQGGDALVLIASPDGRRALRARVAAR